MWVARDKGMNGSEGRLRLFVKEKPARHIYYDKWTVLGGNAYGNMGECPPGYCIDVESNMFPNLKWEDEPLEVDFNVTYNPNIKYYEIIKKKDFYLIIILSIGQTGEYWKYLLEDVKDCKVPIYFDFLYRNGSMNRLFVMGDDGFLAKAITTDRSLIKKLTQLTHDYFTKNKDKLKGSALTKSQLEEYGV